MYMYMRNQISPKNSRERWMCILLARALSQGHISLARALTGTLHGQVLRQGFAL